MTVFVKNKVKWLHEYVLAGSQKERVSYDQLTMGQLDGWLLQVHVRRNLSKNREAMLEYLISLLDDSNDFSWPAAKASHAVFLCSMEQGEIQNYQQFDKIDRIHRAHAQRHITQTDQNLTKIQNTKRDKNTKSMVCQYFNLGTCMHSSTHDTKGTLYRHICAYCHSKYGKALLHMESECRNKNKLSKMTIVGTGRAIPKSLYIQKFSTGIFIATKLCYQKTSFFLVLSR